MRVEILCSDPEAAFAGQWPGPEGSAELLDRMRTRSRRLGIPIQLTVEGQGVWSISPTGKVVSGRLFDQEKLTAKKSRRRALRSPAAP